jgi:hypothetical protein
MLYFEHLPILNYDSLDSEELAKMRNIFFRLDIKNINEDWTRFYRINGIQRLDTISYELYGTTDYWWIICLINDIHDIIFDIPVEEELIQQVATDRTLALYPALTSPGALTYRSEQLEKLVSENDEKRLIRVVNPANIGKIITAILKSL